MTFTYDAPGVSEKDTVRFLLQDTASADAFLSDEEIEYAIAKWMPLWGTLEYVAATLADTIASRYAREASYSADGVSVSLGPVGQQYHALAVSLRAQHTSLLVGGSPDAGGISPYEQRGWDIKNFSFGVGMHDDLEAGDQNYGDRGAPYYPVEENPGV